MSDYDIEVTIRVDHDLAEKIANDGHTAEDMQLMMGAEVVERIAEAFLDRQD